MPRIKILDQYMEIEKNISTDVRLICQICQVDNKGTSRMREKH